MGGIGGLRWASEALSMACQLLSHTHSLSLGLNSVRKQWGHKKLWFIVRIETNLCRSLHGFTVLCVLLDIKVCQHK